MAYTDDQRSQHIAEIQRYLYSISHYNEKIPRIFPDGIYGPETEQAVKAFQTDYKLPVTGEIDKETWDKLVEVYLHYNKDSVFLDVFPPTFVLKPGDRGPIVYIIQVIINTLSLKFDNIKPVDVNGIYDEATHAAVELFKKISGNDNGESGINVDTWNNMASGFNMLEKTNGTENEL